MSDKPTALLDRIIDRILDVTAVVGGCMVVFQMLIVCLEVILRYFFNRPTTWVTEISSYILVWVPFLCVAWVEKRNQHIRMDLLYGTLNPKTRAVFDVVHAGVTVIVCIVIFWYGFKVIAEYYQEGTRTQSFLMLPQWPITAIIPLSLLLLCVELLRGMRKKLNQIL
jgi:TRAP-type C4-dicarboxylate transport system permease small subunit